MSLGNLALQIKQIIVDILPHFLNLTASEQVSN